MVLTDGFHQYSFHVCNMTYWTAVLHDVLYQCPRVLAFFRHGAILHAWSVYEGH